jgi:hypothetical protein
MAAARKPYRRSSVQFNIRATPEEAALIRAAFPNRELTSAAVQLLVTEAQARLRQQLGLSDVEDVPVEGRTTEAA